MKETWIRESMTDGQRGNWTKKERERGSNQIFRVAAGSRGRTLSLIILSDNGLTHTHRVSPDPSGRIFPGLCVCNVRTEICSNCCGWSRRVTISGQPQEQPLHRLPQQIITLTSSHPQPSKQPPYRDGEKERESEMFLCVRERLPGFLLK